MCYLLKIFFFEEAKLVHLNWYWGESNLRPRRRDTSRSQTNTTPTQVDIYYMLQEEVSL